MTRLTPNQLATALGHVDALARALEDERARSARYRAAWINATNRARRHKDGWDGGIDLVRRLEAERDHLADRVCACGTPHYCQSEINDLTARITAQLEGDAHDRARHNLAEAEKLRAELRNCAAALVHNTERARSAESERDELVAAHQSDERNWVALHAERDQAVARGEAAWNALVHLGRLVHALRDLVGHWENEYCTRVARVEALCDLWAADEHVHGRVAADMLRAALADDQEDGR